MLTRAQPLVDITPHNPLTVDRLAELRTMSKLDERQCREVHNIQQSQSINSDTIVDTVKEIKQEIKGLSDRLPQLQQLHKRSLMSVDAEEAHRHNQDIDALNQSINQTAGSIRTKLAALSPLSPSKDASKTDKLAQTQQRKLGKSFMSIMRQFEDSQNYYKQQLRQQLQRQYLIVNPEATTADLESLGDDQQAIAQKTLAEMRDRHADIKMIERSVNDLHQLFCQVQLVVDQHGDLLDRLETQIGDTAMATEAAAGEMSEAVKKKRSAQRKKWILILITLVILGIIGLSLGISLSHK